MSIIIGWLLLSAVVSIAASSRGRNGVFWFVIAVVTSPLIAFLFVFALPNLKQEATLERIASGTNQQKLLHEIAMESDGALNGIPYRVATDGSIYAIMQGAPVKFADFEKFTKAVGG